MQRQNFVESNSTTAQVQTRTTMTNTQGSVCFGVSRGRIEVIMGPMFSGKSTELLRRLERHRIAHKNVVLIKHKSDLRYEGSESCVVTHDQKRKEAKLIVSELNETLFNEPVY